MILRLTKLAISTEHAGHGVALSPRRHEGRRSPGSSCRRVSRLCANLSSRKRRVRVGDPDCAAISLLQAVSLDAILHGRARSDRNHSAAAATLNNSRQVLERGVDGELLAGLTAWTAAIEDG